MAQLGLRREGFAGHPRIGATAARSATLGAAAHAIRKAHSPSFLPSLSLRPSHVDGRFPFVARRAAFLFPTTALAISPRSALCSEPRSAATPPRRLGSRPSHHWP